MYIILAFLTGVSIVISMMLNGRLAEKEGKINGILINYIFATLSSLLLCIILLPSQKGVIAWRDIPLYYLIGGSIGVATTYIFNLVVPKVPAVYVVILRFIGQMITSSLIDYLSLNIISVGKVIGTLIFLIGLVYNATTDVRYKRRQEIYEIK